MINDVDETVNHFIPRGNYIPRSSRPEGVPQHYSIAEPDQSLPKLYFNAAQARKKSSRLHDEMQQLAHDWASDKAAFYEGLIPSPPFLPPLTFAFRVALSLTLKYFCNRGAFPPGGEAFARAARPLFDPRSRCR